MTKPNSHINPNLKRSKKQLDVHLLFEELRSGSLSALSKAITLVESQSVQDTAFAKAILQKALPYSGHSFRLGITGVPGVGKSTFIEALGGHLLKSGKQLAVLAIDPSSNLTKGSILGDKTRMEELVRSEHAFIRPSPAGNTLGGVARKTREAIILCEAAGYDFIIVETVGVGQSETAVHSMTDFFLLLKLAGAGDDLQGIKRGIMEMADAIVINKADGTNQTPAQQAKRAFNNALHLMPAKKHGWPTKVHLCSALHDRGIIEVWQEIQAFQKHTQQNEMFINKRKDQERYWLQQTIEDRLKTDFFNKPGIAQQLKELEALVMNKSMTAFEAAERLLKL